MSSNSHLFGVVKDGDYNVNWDAKGKSGKLKPREGLQRIPRSEASRDMREMLSEE